MLESDITAAKRAGADAGAALKALELQLIGGEAARHTAVQPWQAEGPLVETAKAVEAEKEAARDAVADVVLREGSSAPLPVIEVLDEAVRAHQIALEASRVRTEQAQVAELQAELKAVREELRMRTEQKSTRGAVVTQLHGEIDRLTQAIKAAENRVTELQSNLAAAQAEAVAARAAERDALESFQRAWAERGQREVELEHKRSAELAGLMETAGRQGSEQARRIAELELQLDSSGRLTDEARTAFGEQQRLSQEYLRHADELREQLTRQTLEAKTQTDQRIKALSQVAGSAATVRQLQQDAEARRAELEALEKRLTQALADNAAREEALGRSVAQSRARNRRLAGQLETLKAANSAAAKQANELLEGVRGQHAAQLSELENALSAAREEAARLRLRTAALRQQSADIVEGFQTKLQQLQQEATAAQETAERQLASANRELVDVNALLTEQAKSRSVDQGATAQRLAELEAERNELTDEKTAWTGERLALGRNVAAAHAEVERLRQEAKNARAEVVAAAERAREDSAQAQLGAAEIERLSAQLRQAQTETSIGAGEHQRALEELQTLVAASAREKSDLRRELDTITQSLAESRQAAHRGSRAPEVKRRPGIAASAARASQARNDGSCRLQTSRTACQDKSSCTWAVKGGRFQPDANPETGACRTKAGWSTARLTPEQRADLREQRRASRRRKSPCRGQDIESCTSGELVDRCFWVARTDRSHPHCRGYPVAS